MVSVHPQYITDSEGKKLSVIIAVQEFDRIMEELEELEDVRLFDEAKKDKEPSIPIEEAFKIIDAKRQNKK
jgi:hypothetical protein